MNSIIQVLFYLSSFITKDVSNNEKLLGGTFLSITLLHQYWYSIYKRKMPKLDVV